MELWRVVIDGAGDEGHTERFVTVKGFAEIAAALALASGESVKLAQLVRVVKED